MSLIKNKVVFVTGGAGLLGREFVKAIVLGGGKAIIADIDESKGISITNELKTDLKTENIDFILFDITSKISIQKNIEYVRNKYKKIDALVNNAYPKNENYGRHFFDVEYDDFCLNITMHLGGYFLTSQQFARYFKIQGYGNIVNIASIQGIQAPKFDTYLGTDMTSPVEYSAIKAGIINLTRYMAKYFKGLNIRVNSISPGGIFNNQPDIFISRYKKYCLNKGLLDESDVSGTLLFLLSDMSQYINGQNLVIDDGWTL